MSVRFRRKCTAHVAPDEWDPRAGELDVCARDAASVEAVALTPAEAMHARTSAPAATRATIRALRSQERLTAEHAGPTPTPGWTEADDSTRLD